MILPVGKLAIARFLEFKKLTEVVGQRLRYHTTEVSADLIPLPHPTGASTWHRTQPGKQLLENALAQIAIHPAWKEVAE